jgi:hypothetical protein
LATIIAAAISIATYGQVSVAIRVGRANARKSPSAQAQVVAMLHRGETFIITDDLPYWYKVTLKNGRSAFVPKSACTVIGDDDLENTQPPPSETPAPPDTSSGTVNVPSCTERTIPADWSICPATGSGGKYAQAYVQKNRLSIPCSYTPMSVDDLLALQGLPQAVRALPDTDSRLQYLKQMEAKAVRVEGFLAMAKDGGPEGVNCPPTNRLDTHMELVDTDQADPKTNRQKHVVTEVTPWFHEALPAWSTQALGNFASYVGGYGASQESRPPTKIRVYGYLFYDEAHAGNAGAWRGTAWEVHPITRIEVLESGEWKELK